MALCAATQRGGDEPGRDLLIEQEMFFALGFVTAGLVALACLPAIWRRAIRLTTRRLRQLVPLSGEEIVAERDQLRAVFAVEQRRLEQKLERSDAARTGILADVGRRDAQILALEGELARADARSAELAAELDATQRELYGVRAGTGAAEIALHDALGLAEKRRWDLLAAEERARDLDITIDEGRASIAALETRVLGLEARLNDLNQALGVTKAELARTVEAVARAAGERDAARRAAEALSQERDAVLAARDRGAADAERGRSSTDGAERRAVDAARGGAVEAAQAHAAQRVTIDELRTERDNFAAELAMGREAGRAAAETIRTLRSEAAALESRLADLQARPTPTEADVARVRDAIRQVSDEVLRFAQGGGPGSAGPQTATGPGRDPGSLSEAS